MFVHNYTLIKLFLAVWLLSALGCTEPTLGRVCSEEDPALARQLIKQEPGRTNIALDLLLESCVSATCVSSDESRPYCTEECTTDADCSEVEGFICRQATSYSRLGCLDWTEEEDCFPGGVPSTQPRKFCIAENAEVISNWDAEYGQTSAVPEDWVGCDPSFYGSGDGCDCGCGVQDPDCVDGSAASCGLTTPGRCQLSEAECTALASEVYVHCESSAPCILDDDNTTCGSTGSVCLLTDAERAALEQAQQNESSEES